MTMPSANTEQQKLSHTADGNGSPTLGKRRTSLAVYEVKTPCDLAIAILDNQMKQKPMVT